jgi:tetratricopeptide (TPR) repeat protein
VLLLLAWWGLVRSPADFWTGHVGRAALGIGLAALGVLGFSLVAAAMAAVVGPRARVAAAPWTASPSAWVLAGGLAFGVPLVFALDLARRQTQAVETAILEARFVDAAAGLRRLQTVASPFHVGGMTPQAAAQALQQRWHEVSARAAVGLPPSAGDEDRVRQAEDLLVLGRGGEALFAIRPAAARHAPAALLAGQILQRRRAWSESSLHYRRALAMLAAQPPSTERLAAQVRAYDALAFNLREEARFAEAQMLYEEALALLPAAAAHFHFQLGLHLHRYADRPTAARAQLERAAALDPLAYGPRAAQAIAAELSLQGVSCWRGRDAGSGP